MRVQPALRLTLITGRHMLRTMRSNKHQHHAVHHLLTWTAVTMRPSCSMFLMRSYSHHQPRQTNVTIIRHSMRPHQSAVMKNMWLIDWSTTALMKMVQSSSMFGGRVTPTRMTPENWRITSRTVRFSDTVVGMAYQCLLIC